jgi:hypothetical protein
MSRCGVAMVSGGPLVRHGWTLKHSGLGRPLSYGYAPRRIRWIKRGGSRTSLDQTYLNGQTSHLAKVRVAGSKPVFFSQESPAREPLAHCQTRIGACPYLLTHRVQYTASLVHPRPMKAALGTAFAEGVNVLRRTVEATPLWPITARQPSARESGRPSGHRGDRFAWHRAQVRAHRSTPPAP